jgi:hypothetical protein
LQQRALWVATTSAPMSSKWVKTRSGSLHKPSGALGQ